MLTQTEALYIVTSTIDYEFIDVEKENDGSITIIVMAGDEKNSFSVILQGESLSYMDENDDGHFFPYKAGADALQDWLEGLYF